MDRLHGGDGLFQIGHPAGLSARFVEEYRKEAHTRVKTLMERLEHRFYEAGESAVRDVDTDEDFKRMLEELGYRQIELRKDLSGNDRMIKAIRP